MNIKFYITLCIKSFKINQGNAIQLLLNWNLNYLYSKKKIIKYLQKELNQTYIIGMMYNVGLIEEFTYSGYLKTDNKL